MSRDVGVETCHLHICIPVQVHTAVVHDEAVSSTVVAQENLAAVAVPYGFVPLLSPVMVAIVAAARFVCPSHWEVILTKPLSRRSHWGMASTFPATVVSNQCFRQINSKLLHGGDRKAGMILAQYICIRNLHVKQKPPDVLVILPSL